MNTDLHKQTEDITRIILDAAAKARRETDNEPEPNIAKPAQWPITCTVGPGLEGAIACESKVGYVNGAKGWLVYRGYDIFDLCAYSTYEEVAYLLLFGKLPTAAQLAWFKERLMKKRRIPGTMRQLMGQQVETMNPMAALRLGILFMRRERTTLDQEQTVLETDVIGSDEDSIPMETKPLGESRAIYEFPGAPNEAGTPDTGGEPDKAILDACQLIAAPATLTAGIARLRAGHLPIEAHPDLGHAANLLYMMTGREPTPTEERVMDVSLILHADHGMNASTFAAMVVASTLSDIYFSVGSGIAALNGPLHGGANEQVLYMLREIGGPQKVPAWFEEARASKRKIMGFGHRVYKAYDPRARVLGPLADYLVHAGGRPDSDPMARLHTTARRLEEAVVEAWGSEKRIFPNVDFYSGLVYGCLRVPPPLFTPLFAVSRVAGWTARVLEYLENNRIFRPRALYTGAFEKPYIPLAER
jgi:citrate synthase